MNPLKPISIALVLIIFCPLIVDAGWFSNPENFEECVLEKMKGQDKSMRIYAIRACRKLFPQEEELTYFHTQNIEISWSYVSSSSVELTIEKNESSYRISKCIASFSIKKCDETQSNEDYIFTETFLFKDGKQKSRLKIKKANQYNCMGKMSIWGFLKQ